MSVADFQFAVAGRTTLKHAIVSSNLFFQLLNQGIIAPQVTQAYIPSDSRYKEPIDNLIKSMGVNPDDPVPIIFYTLVSQPSVVVDQDIQHDMRLPASGPASFVLR